MTRGRLRTFKALTLLVGILLPIILIEAALRLRPGAASYGENKRERQETLDRLQKTGARDDGAAATYDSELKVHPFFGYVHNHTFKKANNFGFGTPYDFLVRPSGYEIKGAANKEKEPLVVGIFGGSYAGYIGYDCAPLEERLRAAYPDREPYVVAMAAGGHALPQAGFIYQYFRSLFDVVIFIDGLNELWNTWENNDAGQPPVYAKAAHFQYRLALIELTQDRLIKTQQIVALKDRRIRSAQLSLVKGLRQLRLTHKIWENFDQRREAAVSELERELKESYQDKEPWVKWSPEESFAFTANQWRDWHKITGAVAELQGAKFLHYLQPVSLVPDTKKVMTPAEKLAMEARPDLNYFTEIGYPFLQKVVAELNAVGYPAHDLTKVYYDIEGEIWADAMHPNTRGQEVVLDLLADDIIAALGGESP